MFKKSRFYDGHDGIGSERLRSAERGNPDRSDTMVDLTADGTRSAVESNLLSDVQGLLRDMTGQCASQKGLLRWRLEKKVEAEPSCSASLMSVLVKELEIHSMRSHIRSHTHVIPLLHTLYYVVIQSGSVIPSSLYHRVYQCLMKLLILPLPYSAVALSTLRSIKMEMTTSGSLYQRRVIAEQNLKNKHFTMQEKVFVLADPAVFSAPLEAAVRACLDGSGSFRDAPTMERDLMTHVLQKGLGTECRRSRLSQALEALGDQMVEGYFEEVVSAVEQSIKHGTGGCAAYRNTLQKIHRDILTAAEEEINEEDCGSVCSSAMSYPEITFLMWNNEEDLWNLLANFTLRSCSSSSFDDEERGTRESLRSEARETDGDTKESDSDAAEQARVRNPASSFTRRNAYKKMNSADKLSLVREKMEVFPGSSPILKEDRRCHTARVVVMGDDRVLGRLTRAYHSIREKESKHLMLTKKLNLQLYYIPVTDVDENPCPDESRLSLAFLLSRVDPWYNSNISSLRATISKLAGKRSNHSEPSERSLFLLDTLCYYLRCGTQPVHLPLYSVKMTRSSHVTPVVEEVFVSHLEADLPEFRHLKNKFSKETCARRKKSAVEAFGAVITVSYTKTSLSKRKVVRGDSLMTCGVVITSEPAAVTRGEDYLAVSFNSVNPGYNKKIQTQNVSIRTMEHRMFSVCLDRDSRRTYTDVQRIEISPCLDSGCSIRSRFCISNERELPLSKYLNNVLSLPINTFTGVSDDSCPGHVCT